MSRTLLPRGLAALLLFGGLASPARAAPPDAATPDIYLYPATRTAPWHAGWSDARISGDLVFVSGVVVALREDETAADLDAAFERGFLRLTAILHAAGASLANVVDLTAYMTDVEHQTPALDRVRLKHMQPPYAASTVVQVVRLIPPRGVAELRVVARTPAR